MSQRIVKSYDGIILCLLIRLIHTLVCVEDEKKWVTGLGVLLNQSLKALHHSRHESNWPVVIRATDG